VKEMTTSSFGPGALATPANAVTVARLLISPALFAMINGRNGSWPAAVVWLGLCCTDGFDGYLARRQGTTRSGAFLDPLADKVLVLGALFALVSNHVFWWLPVAIIAVRELAISLYRSYAGRRGITVPARWWAKVKTVCQQVAVGLALIPPIERHAPSVPNGFLWAAVVLTVVTGTQYFLDARAVSIRQLPAA
jgi:CDP-diacylglycerol--glycerol-3-phosphate 3-phosphatidyltransferase